MRTETGEMPTFRETAMEEELMHEELDRKEGNQKSKVVTIKGEF